MASRSLAYEGKRVRRGPRRFAGSQNGMGVDFGGNMAAVP